MSFFVLKENFVTVEPKLLGKLRTKKVPALSGREKVGVVAHTHKPST